MTFQRFAAFHLMNIYISIIHRNLKYRFWNSYLSNFYFCYIAIGLSILNQGNNMVYSREIVNDLIEYINIQDVFSKDKFNQKMQRNSIIIEFSHFLFSFTCSFTWNWVSFNLNIFFIPRMISFIFSRSYLTLQNRP